MRRKSCSLAIMIFIVLISFIGCVHEIQKTTDIQTVDNYETGKYLYENNNVHSRMQQTSLESELIQSNSQLPNPQNNHEFFSNALPNEQEETYHRETVNQSEEAPETSVIENSPSRSSPSTEMTQPDPIDTTIAENHENPSASLNADITQQNLFQPVHSEIFNESQPSQGRSIMVIVLIVIIIILFFLFILFYKKWKAEKEKVSRLHIDSIETANNALYELQENIRSYEEAIKIKQDERSILEAEESELRKKCDNHTRKTENQKKKLSRMQELASSIAYAVSHFHEADIPSAYYLPLSKDEKADLDTLAPSVILNLNLMNYQDLRKEFRVNQKQIDELLEAYQQRYTTKGNQTIYQLMVMALRSELQNILYNLKFEKLDTAIEQVKRVTSKYLLIAAEGNQQIEGTIRKFIGELEHLFINAVKIEYEYFIKREQVRQEQLALRQQMKEEAEERKRLKEQEKQFAIEETKFKTEIAKLQEALNDESADTDRKADIETRMTMLEEQLKKVEEQKEDIAKLQNGKAGNVYIISNLGSFGDHVFKIGMTRRLDPQDRINELGGASVPFTFDVHSFIFSDNAVDLENEIHKRLHTRRLNKVNLRKEFFDVSLDELESLVLEVNPTAEFNRTLLAEDYKQSLSMDSHDLPPIPDYSDEDEEEIYDNDEKEAI